MSNVLRPDFGRPRAPRASFMARRVERLRAGVLDRRPGSGGELHELHRREDPGGCREGDEPPPLAA
jgi:hypothetical protein